MHQVEDVSFGFELPEPEPVAAEEPEAEPESLPAPVEPSPPAPPSNPTSSRPTPNSSAKRARPGRGAARPSSTSTAHTTRSSTANSPQEPVSASRTEIYDISDHSSTDETQVQVQERLKQRKSSALRRVSLAVPEETELPVAPAVPSVSPASPARSPTSLPRGISRRSVASPLARSSAAAVVGHLVRAEEVAESPSDAPGSGMRRPMRIGQGAPVIGSSTLLQRVLDELDETTEHPPSSSPAQRAAATRRSSELLRQRSSAEARRRQSVRLSGSSAGRGGDEIQEDELTPSRPRQRMAVTGRSRPKPGSGKKPADEDASTRRAEPRIEEMEEQEQEQGEGQEQVDEEAEEISDNEAAQRLATKKRPRRSLPAPSPELHSEPPSQHEPAAKRRRKKDVASPAPQQQPKPKPPEAKPTKKQPAAGRKPRKSTAAPDDADDDEADGGSVPVLVQRFTSRVEADREDPDADILNAEIPFANRDGVNAIDVLSKLCEELVDAFLAKLQKKVENAEDAASRREQRTMLRALEAFQEELRTRLLEHVSTYLSTCLPSLGKSARASLVEKREANAGHCGLDYRAGYTARSPQEGARRAKGEARAAGRDPPHSR